MWVSLRGFNSLGEPAQVWNVGTPCEGLCRKMADHFVTKLLGLPIRMYNTFASKNLILGQQARPVCWQSLIVGGYSRVFHVDTSAHRSVDSLLYEYRALALIASGFNPDYIPYEHHIVLVNKHRSNRGTLRNIVNLQEVETFIRRTYSGIKFTVVDWKDLTVDEQFSMLLSTTLVISPAGGSSMLLPFLPLGSHAIIMDYKRENRSISLEGGFWDHWSHIKNDYYLVQNPEESVWDDACDKGDPKECTRVIVNVNTLQVLVDAALAEMSISNPLRLWQSGVGTMGNLREKQKMTER